MTNETPTPETDAVFELLVRENRLFHEMVAAVTEQSRKHERERDGYKLFYQNTREQFDQEISRKELHLKRIEELERERDQLRKVADELAKALDRAMPDARFLPQDEIDVMVCAALAAYNNLPHKKGQP